MYFSIAHLALFVNNNYTSAEKKNKMMAWTFSRTLENLRVCLNGVFTHNLQLQSISGPCLTAGTFSEAPFSFAPHPATALPTPGSSSAPQLCYLHSVSNSSYPVTRNSGVQCLVRHAQIPGWHWLRAVTCIFYFFYFFFLRKHGTQLPRISHRKSKHEMFQHKSEADNKGLLTSFPLVRFLKCLAKKENGCCKK